MKTVVKSESGHQYFVIDKDGFIECVFYNLDMANLYANKKRGNK